MVSHTIYLHCSWPLKLLRCCRLINCFIYCLMQSFHLQEKLMVRKWLNSAKALARRAGYYNRSLEISKQYEKEGRVLIVAPESIGKMKTLTKDEDSICMMYEEGREDAKKIRDFLEA